MTTHKNLINSLPGADDITRVVLPNGITILARANFNTPAAALHGYLDTGSLSDTDDKLGLADFTASMLMRGTQQKSFNEVFELLEASGASLGFSGNVHTTSFTGKSLVEDLPMLIGLLREVVSTPAFPETYVEKMRGQLLTGLALRAQDTAGMAGLTFDKLLYGMHPYARPEDGYPETIAAITREDIAAYHRSYYGPRGMVIVVVGAMQADEVVDLIRAAFSDWGNPGQVLPPALPAYTPPAAALRQDITIPGKVQADIVAGTWAPRRSDPDYLPISLGNSVLGQFGMYGRIGDVVREQSGLAYYAYTRLNSGIGPGTWEVSAGVNPQNIEKTIDLVRTEIKRYTREPVSDEELEDTKANYIGRLPLSLESNAGVASALLSLERYNLGLDYFRQYAQKVTAVTPGQVLEASRKFLDADRLVVATAGPQQGK